MPGSGSFKRADFWRQGSLRVSSVLLAGSLLLGACAGSGMPAGQEQAHYVPLQERLHRTGPGAAPIQQAALVQPGLAQPSLAQADLDDEEAAYDYDDATLFGYTQEEEGDGDPLETLNRFTFAFNEMLDTFFLRPAAFTYRELVPLGIRNAVRSFLRTISTPVILANDLLQGDGERALITSKRFFVNTAFSLGFYDYAAELDLPYHSSDFGQTLGVHGVGEGFYLVLPVFGPSSARDTAGTLVDSFMDPLSYLAAEDLNVITLGEDARPYSYGRSGASGLEARSRTLDVLDQALEGSLDHYTRVRSLWRQAREADIQKRSRAEEPDFGLGGLP